MVQVVGDAQAALERSVLELAHVVVRLGRAALLGALGADRQHTLGDLDIDIGVGVHARNLGTDLQGAVGHRFLDPDEVLEVAARPRQGHLLHQIVETLQHRLGAGVEQGGHGVLLGSDVARWSSEVILGERGRLVSPIGPGLGWKDDD